MFEESEIYKAIVEKSEHTPEKTLAALKQGRVDVNTRNNQHETFLHVVARTYIEDVDAPALIPVVFQLSNAGIDVNAVDQNGNNALHIAAKSSGARRLIRALVLIGVDPLACNSEKNKPSKLAKNCPENLKVLKFLSPGLWNAVEKGSKEDVLKLASNWCKINDSRNKMTLSQLAQQGGNDEIRQILNKRTNTNTFVHFVLAGDRTGMRPFFKKGNVDINTKSACLLTNNRPS
jgi:ankyrin repeat protein